MGLQQEDMKIPNLICAIIEYTFLFAVLVLAFEALDAYRHKPSATVTESKSFGVWESCIQAGGLFSEADGGRIVTASCSYEKVDK